MDLQLTMLNMESCTQRSRVTLKNELVFLEHGIKKRRSDRLIAETT
jgi:hypothetical protein